MYRIDEAAPLQLSAFADETRYNSGRYRAIAVISARASDASQYKLRISEILKESSVSEFKWKKLDSAKGRFAAEKIVKFVFDEAASNRLRADILLWDTNDRRHIVRRRDDIANLQRMYYHLLKNVFSARWPDGSRWNVFPDENMSLNWKQVEDYLGMASMRTEINKKLPTDNSFKLRLVTEFKIDVFTPCKSHAEPLVQVADLFAGLGAYSYDRFPIYCEWKKTTTPQGTFEFEPQPTVPKFSCADRERCPFLGYFDRQCKSRKFGVSLESNRGLRTFDPRNPINFWMYTPQHERDIAPVQRAG